VSEQNVELHRSFIEGFNARAREATIELCDPEIEFHSVFAAVGGAVYHGHAGVRKWLRDLEDAWGEDLRAEPEAYFDLGQHTLGFHVLRGRGRQSGAKVVQPYATAARWRDGLMVYFKAYVHREDALSELGVSEDVLSPIAP
jgi:ketosteroid isomerase-like protein